MAFDIGFLLRAINASMEAFMALKRMRQADEKLEKAQRASGGDKAARLAEALEEYNRRLAELVEYLNVSSRHHRAD